MSTGEHAIPSARKIIGLVFKTLGSERSYIFLVVIYGVGISLLSLATPIAVQVLINSVGYTALTVPLVVLSLTLFGLLLASGLLNALRVHLMEIFSRRFYARLVSEISLKALYAQRPFFHDEGRDALFNRYFDIIVIQKAMPVLLIGGFTILLQAAVGFVLTSFYHPLFLAFNGVVIIFIWIIWLVWGPSAVRSAAYLSQEKHRAAAWLQGLAASNGFFKSEHHIAHALQQTDQVTHNYVEAHKKHFRQHFAQTLGFLILYAAASASLLGLGGWLVIQGQLTLGQLVAAELVLSVAFFGVSQLGSYLNYFYDLCAGCEELSLLEEIELEEPVGLETLSGHCADLEFNSVRGVARGRPVELDFQIPAGAKVQAVAEGHGVQRLFTNLLKRFEDPKGGALMLGGNDITDTQALTLRRLIVVLDRPSLVQMTIRSYLRLAKPDTSSAEMIEALRVVGLEESIEELEDGLDTIVSTTGWPLSVGETMRLKLAAAILARPKVLILNQLYDTLPDPTLKAAISYLETISEGPPTVIVFSSRLRDLDLGNYLYLGRKQQVLLENYDGFKPYLLTDKNLGAAATLQLESV